MERTTIADIARAADVPVGNVYYYFKTKDELVEAALAEHSGYLAVLIHRLDQLPDPRERLKGLVATWVAQRDTAARFGCPTGTLAVELDKRAEGGLDLAFPIMEIGLHQDRAGPMGRPVGMRAPQQAEKG